VVSAFSVYGLFQQRAKHISVIQLAAITDLNTVPQFALGVELDAGNVDDRFGVESGAANLAVRGTRTGTGVGRSLEIVGSGEIGSAVNVAGYSCIYLHFGQQSSFEPEHTGTVVHHLIPFCSGDRELLTGAADDGIVGIGIAETIAGIICSGAFSHVDFAAGGEHLVAVVNGDFVDVIFAYPAGFAGGVLDFVPVTAMLIGFGLVEVLKGTVRVNDAEFAAVVVAGSGANGNTAAVFGHIGYDVGSLIRLRSIEVCCAGGHRRDKHTDEHDEGENERSDTGLIFHFEFLQIV